MNVASLVHASRYRQQQQHHQQQQQQHHQYQHQAHPHSTALVQSTATPPAPYAMAASMMAGPYAMHQIPNPYAFLGAPQAPPSPPVEEVPKCSLPSISSLLGLTDVPSPPEPSQLSPTSPVDHPPGLYPAPTGGSSKIHLPPTPPMQAESGFEGRQSPTTTSQFSLMTATTTAAAAAPSSYSYYASGGAINNLEPHAQRQIAHSTARRPTISMPSTTYQTSSPYTPSPQQSMSSYYPSPVQPTPPPQQVSGLYYQRPLPQNFPPPLIPVSVTLEPSSGGGGSSNHGNNPWQHHHYIAPSSQASFPPSQDRYICPTCNKAFSRPSSLRIHSHSHTGEKPFKCPHHGCGKAFSVRSNMKRHERGCHSFDGSSSSL